MLLARLSQRRVAIAWTRYASSSDAIPKEEVIGADTPVVPTPPSPTGLRGEVMDAVHKLGITEFTSIQARAKNKTLTHTNTHTRV